MKHSDNKMLFGIVVSAGCIFIIAVLAAKLYKQDDISPAEAQPTIEASVETEESSDDSSEEIVESESSKETEEQQMLTGAEELDEGIVVEAPREMEWEEALDLLEARSKEDERYIQVLEHLEEYPLMLVMDLVVNPEMISFVCDYPDGVGLEAEIRPVEMEQDCPLFLQWEKRWGYQKYGTSSTIAVSGCGPTALAMVATALTHEPVTPLEVANYAMEQEYYLPGVGTMWSLMTTGAAHYGLDSEQMEPDDYFMKKMLDRGEILICSMRKGDFTINGHFIVIYGYDSDGFIVNDPMCIYRSKQRWTFTQLRKQFKAIWSLCPKGEKPEEFYQIPESTQPQEVEPDPEIPNITNPGTPSQPAVPVNPSTPSEPVTPPSEPVTPPSESVTPPSESEETPPSESEETSPSESEETPPSESQETPPSESQETTPSESQETPPSESGVTPSSGPEESEPPQSMSAGSVE